MSAKKKLGIACPTTAMDSAMRSSRVFGRSAARTPRGIDTINANDRDRSPSVIVTGALSQTICATGCFR